MATGGNLSIVKAFDILDIVCKHRRGPSLRELACEASMPVATTHRILTTLKRVGALQTTTEGKYTLGARLLNFCLRDINHQRQIFSLVSEHLSGVEHSLQGQVCLSFLDDEFRIHRIAGADAEACQTKNGQKTQESFMSAAGKILLGAQPSAVISKCLAKLLAVDASALAGAGCSSVINELKLIAAQGYAVDVSDIANGNWTVAVPVREKDKTVAAISLSIVQKKFSGSEMYKVVEQLKQSAFNLTRYLNCADGCIGSLAAYQEFECRQ